MRMLLLALLSLMLAGCENERDAPTPENAALKAAASEPGSAESSAAPADAAAQADGASPPAVIPCPRLERVAVVGASASDGFLAQLVLDESGEARIIDLAFSDVVQALLLDEAAIVSRHTDYQFFSNPEEYGPALLADALKQEPTLIVGVDLLFWYAYGTAYGTTNVEEEVAARTRNLERGFVLVADLPCPLILGDFPDMSSAAPWMLPRHMIPSDEALAALNEQLYDWAEGQDDVIVFPLHDLHRQMKSGEPLHIGDNEWDAEAARALLLTDGLHPSDEGLIALGLKVADLLVAEDEQCLAQHFVQRTEDVRQRLQANFAAPVAAENVESGEEEGATAAPMSAGG